MRFCAVELPSNSRLKVSSLGLSLLHRVSCSVAAAFGNPLAASSLAVPVPFGVFPVLGSHLTPKRNQPPGLRCLLSVSHALKASIRPTPIGRVRADPAHGVSPSGSLSLAEHPTFSGGAALLRLFVALLQPQPNCAPHSRLYGHHNSALVKIAFDATRSLQGLHPRECWSLWPFWLGPAKVPDPPGLHLPRGISLSTGRRSRPYPLLGLAGHELL